MTRDETVLEIEGLNVDIPTIGGTVHALRDVSLSIGASETLCIVGESGCGKSMTSLAIMRLLPRSAKVHVRSLNLQGEDLYALGDRKMSDLRGDRVAMIFQEPMTSLNPTLTIGTQLTEVYLRHRAAGHREAKERACYMLDRVGLSSPEKQLNRYPHELSGGMRQRVMIASALMCDPVLLIADEPTTALDVTIQAQILSLLAELRDAFHMSLILITHDLGVVAKMADRVAVMYAGEVVEIGDVDQLFEDPHHPYTKGLMACVPEAHSFGGLQKKLKTIPGLVPSLIGEQRGCCFMNRCDVSRTDCGIGSIKLSAVSPRHRSRCIKDTFQ